MSESQENQQRRERLRKLALETVDLNKDPYFMRNHLGTYECKLCLTIHTNEGNYLAHTQGKRHQQNIARRLAKDAFEQQVRRGRMAWACCVHACVRTMRDPRASKTFSRGHPRGDRRSHARVVDVCLCRARTWHTRAVHRVCLPAYLPHPMHLLTDPTRIFACASPHRFPSSALPRRTHQSRTQGLHPGATKTDPKTQRKVAKIGRPGYRVTKQKDAESNQRSTP